MEYGWERLADVLYEPNVPELIREHFEESANDKSDCPLAVDFDRLLNLETQGVLKLIVARTDGCLAGYMIWYLQYPIDFSTTLHAIQGPWNMLGLLVPSLKGLREMGVKRVVTHLKTHVAADRGTLAVVFDRAGFRETERVFYRVL